MTDEQRRKDAERLTAKAHAQRRAEASRQRSGPNPQQPAWRRWGIPFVTVFGLLGGCIALVEANDDPPSVGTSSDESSDDSSRTASEGEAWGNCKDEVKARLRNPATADFGILSTTIDDTADDGWKITGEVKGQNDFGVKSSFMYVCMVTPDGYVSDVQMGPA